MGRLPSTDFLHRLADGAARETLPRFRTRLAVDRKATADASFDPVTAADREAETALRAMITAEFPEHSIRGEEFGTTGDGPIQWVLDPVDGTRPFLCGIPVWGTLIGLTVEGRAVLGMMSQPYTGERFWGDDTGAWQRTPRGTERLAVSSVTELGDAILHANSPEGYRGSARAGFDRLVAAVKMTRYGGECYAFAMLAAGWIDLCIEAALQPHDIIPIIPIIERAGGIVTRLDGARAERGGPVLLAATPLLHEAALRLFNG